MKTWKQFVEANANLAPMIDQPKQYNAQRIKTILKKPEGIFVKTDTGILGPVQKVVNTSYGPNIIYIKAGNTPFLADLSAVPLNLQSQFINQFKPTNNLKQAPFASDKDVGNAYSRSMQVQQDAAKNRFR
jgi:hypothetical protein